MADIVSLMERNPATWSYERSCFGNDLLRLRNVDQYEARSRKIEGGPRQPCGSSVPLEHFDVPEAAL